MAVPSKSKAIERLRNVLNKIPELKKLRYDSQEFTRWHRDARVAIAYTFGNDSIHIKEFDGISFTLWVVSTATSDSDYQSAYWRGLDSTVPVIESMIYEIKEYWEDGQPLNVSDITAKPPTDTDKVFVVHGHDESARETVARFLEKLELTPIILHEQPNGGRTIIEKFEDYAEVGFAVILLTPDDIGASGGSADELGCRARQNVILELGFFLGRLGRDRVCALVKGDVETPSDYDGVVYTEFDDGGGWRMKLVRELKNAGFDADANLVL